MFDFSPGGFDPPAFFVSQAIRWAGYALFAGVAIVLGRRLNDWRIPALVIVGLILPEVANEVVGLYRRTVVELSRETRWFFSGAATAGQWLLYAAAIMRSAKLVAQRRSAGRIE